MEFLRTIEHPRATVSLFSCLVKKDLFILFALDINECLPNHCYNGISCANDVGTFKCGPCPGNLAGNGTICIGEC